MYYLKQYNKIFIKRVATKLGILEKLKNTWNLKVFDKNLEKPGTLKNH